MTVSENMDGHHCPCRFIPGPWSDVISWAEEGLGKQGLGLTQGWQGGSLSLFLSFFFYTHLFMCLAMLGLSCGTEDLHHCMRTLVAACRLSISAEYGLLVPQTRIKPASTFTARQVLNHWTTEEVTGGSLEGGQSPC